MLSTQSTTKDYIRAKVMMRVVVMVVMVKMMMIKMTMVIIVVMTLIVETRRTTAINTLVRKQLTATYREKSVVVCAARCGPAGCRRHSTRQGQTPATTP